MKRRREPHDAVKDGREGLVCDRSCVASWLGMARRGTSKNGDYTAATDGEVSQRPGVVEKDERFLLTWAAEFGKR